MYTVQDEEKTSWLCLKFFITSTKLIGNQGYCGNTATDQSRTLYGLVRGK